jgi:hypothetical protein
MLGVNYIVYYEKTLINYCTKILQQFHNDTASKNLTNVLSSTTVDYYMMLCECQ